MCGIAGIYAPGQRVALEEIRDLMAPMAHRGPDDSGVKMLSGGELGLGHLRLAILDISPSGHQPMGSPDGKVWVVFNGEIYNFRELRETLEHGGCRFVTNSDTEVLVAAFCRWGLDCVKQFHGMFAFGLWDDRSHQLHLCRDRFGVKPLFYALRNGRVTFASELKALNLTGATDRRFDPTSIAEFLHYGYVSSPKTIFDDVRTVTPGTAISFGRSLQPSVEQYWSTTDLLTGKQHLDLSTRIGALPTEELLDLAESHLERAFKRRMVSDVPVGLFLSGGIDSSLVAAVLARRCGITPKTFTVGFGASEFDETHYARAMAKCLDADHHEDTITPQSVIGMLGRLPEVADEPIGDSSLIPSLVVSQFARRHVKVALSADGADELFGGYARYQYCSNHLAKSRFVRSLYRLSAELLDQLPPTVLSLAYRLSTGGHPAFAGVNAKLKKFVRLTRAADPFSAYDAVMAEWPIERGRSFYRQGQDYIHEARRSFESVESRDLRDKLMHFDAIRYLPGDLLTKVDRASMYVSLEAREPFLDHELAQFAAALPMEWKIRGSSNKHILRRILERHLPASHFERPKQGFSAPVDEWLRGPLRPVLCDELSGSSVRKAGILDPVAVEEAKRSFLAGDRGASPAGIWFLLQLQQWAGRWANPGRVE